MQNRKQSFTEAATNTIIGYCLSLTSIFIIFPIMGINSTPSKNILLVMYFTLLSITRGYIVRRYFNNKNK